MIGSPAVGQLLVENASLLEPSAGELQPGASLRIEAGRVVEVATEGRALRASAPDTRRIDAAGRTLMPGLIDAHVHAVLTTLDLAALEKRPVTLVAQEARLVLEAMLRRGFTTVRDAGGSDWGLAEAVSRGLIRGPRMLFSGRVLSQTGGHGDFRAREDAPDLCGCRIYTNGFSHVADGGLAHR